MLADASRLISRTSQHNKAVASRSYGYVHLFTYSQDNDKGMAIACSNTISARPVFPLWHVPSISPLFLPFKNGFNVVLWRCFHVMLRRSKVPLTKTTMLMVRKKQETAKKNGQYRCNEWHLSRKKIWLQKEGDRNTQKEWLDSVSLRRIRYPENSHHDHISFSEYLSLLSTQGSNIFFASSNRTWNEVCSATAC